MRAMRAQICAHIQTTTLSRISKNEERRQARPFERLHLNSETDDDCVWHTAQIHLRANSYRETDHSLRRYTLLIYQGK